MASSWQDSDWQTMCLLIKESQNVDGGLWTQYIERASKTKRDPTCHDWEFLARFLTTAAGSNPVVSAMAHRALQAKQYEADKTWDALVMATQGHPYFHRFYGPQIYTSEDLPGWVRAQASTKVPQERKVLAIKTIMVRTSEDARAVLRCVLVDADGKVVLDDWVKPYGSITDDVKAFGTTPEQIEATSTMREQLQQKLLKLISPDTILLGHNTAQDLCAIRLHHAKIVDVGLLCRSFDNPRHAPTLKEIYETIARDNEAMGPRDTDDSEPASAARVLVDVGRHLKDHRMDKPKSHPTPKNVDNGGRQEQQSKLFVHKIPRMVRPEEIQALFQPQPVVGNIKMSSGGTWSALLDFGSPALAMAMFDSVPGSTGQDTRGRAQKSLYIPLMFNSSDTQYVEIKIQKAG